MTIKQIKLEIAAKCGIALPNLQMVRQFAEDKTTPTEWLSHWDNDNRVRITMHQDILKSLKENPNFSGMAIKKTLEEATEERAAYTRVIIITPRNVEATF